MADPTNITRKLVGIAGGVSPDADIIGDIVTQLNNLSASVRLITAKLDLDAGVTDTNYAALVTDSAIATAPTVITVSTGL